ncbi:zinc-dependent metalloprotease [Chitinophaga sp. sic0106]|uniref:zinc-dependent metalloprotease n=1 Tax=Chitinophaga sp. sic0106 TaxID=2854785 RepID=UPI001C438085|nr:zinc-dependent metalloprotease [Chitinophaga sp. sic0106]MBV7531198.1 zinc-dependent metalloprotease [Chitinophaga sp. sic0106]
MKRYTYISLAALMASCAVFKNSHKKKAQPAATTTAAAKPAALPNKNGVKSFAEVITKNMVTKPGMFTVHASADLDSIYLEIPDSLLNRDILVLNRIVKSPGNINVYAGEELYNGVYHFEKGADDKICIREVDMENIADPGSLFYNNVKDNNLGPVVATLPIKAYGKDSASSVILFSAYVKETSSFMHLVDKNDSLRRRVAYPLIKNIEITDVRAYPLNLELAVNKDCPDRDEASIYSLESNTSLVLLPAKPMVRRIIDTRVGYFPMYQSYFEDDQQKAERLAIARRWRLEPKPEDADKYKRGELVEPAKPIVYYIDPKTPKLWRKYLIMGVNDWQVAFEKAGFKNAIVAREWPEGDTTMHMDDARFSFINYFPSEVSNAYGPNVIDPRSGEIIQTHIGWYHNVMQLLRNWYMLQAGPNDPQARHAKFDDELMGQLIRFVSSHEVGHTLGLRHNFGSSSMTPVDSLRSITYLRAHGHTASIMDYARFNYVAQPEDRIPQQLLFPRIGEYDQWAIKWGYTYTGNNMHADNKQFHDMTSAALAANPRLWFGDGEIKKVDPRCQTEDLGDDAAKAGTYGIENLKRVMKNLPVWTYNPEGLHDDLSSMYRQVQSQYFRYMNHALQYIGTLTYTFRADGDKQPVIAAVSTEKQLAALSFLDKQLFTTPTWLIDPQIMSMTANPAPVGQEFLGDLQARVMNSLLDYKRLDYQQTNYERFDKKSLGVDKLLSVLHGMTWRELGNGAIKMDPYRRDLQKNYVGALLDNLSNPAYAEGESDVFSLLLAEADNLHHQIKQAMPKAATTVDKAHLADLDARMTQFENKRKK